MTFSRVRFHYFIVFFLIGCRVGSFATAQIEIDPDVRYLQRRQISQKHLLIGRNGDVISGNAVRTSAYIVPELDLLDSPNVREELELSKNQNTELVKLLTDCRELQNANKDSLIQENEFRERLRAVNTLLLPEQWSRLMQLSRRYYIRSKGVSHCLLVEDIFQIKTESKKAAVAKFATVGEQLAGEVSKIKAEVSSELLDCLDKRSQELFRDRFPNFRLSELSLTILLLQLDAREQQDSESSNSTPYAALGQSSHLKAEVDGSISIVEGKKLSVAEVYNRVALSTNWNKR